MEENGLVTVENKVDINGLKKRLKPRERRFCELYVHKYLHNATRAYLATVNDGKNPKIAYTTASTTASKLLRKDNVRAYIAALEEDFAGKIAISGMEMIAQFQEIAEDPTAQHADRLRALENIAKISGVYAENTDNNTTIQIVSANGINLAK